MTTSQTQVTGPVDDEVFALIDAVVAACDLGPNPTRQDDDKADARIQALSRSITARLAPRADALIEREQIQSAINNGIANAYADFVDAWEPHVYPDGLTFDGRLEAIRDAIDAELALLPRAPMPDVVTISRDDLKFIVENTWIHQRTYIDDGTQVYDRLQVALEATNDR